MDAQSIVKKLDYDSCTPYIYPFLGVGRVRFFECAWERRASGVSAVVSGSEMIRGWWKEAGK